MKQQVMLGQYREVLTNLPPIMTLNKEQLLIDELHIEDVSSLKLYYAPHNDVVYRDAKLLIAGLTPGFQQMQLALAAAQAAIWEGENNETACFKAKRQARFAGTMRNNLILMLNNIGIHHWLELDDCTDLFEKYAHWLHSTSMIRYPAFYNGRNYSGTQPDVINNEAIRSYALEHMRQQVTLFPQTPIIPLGRKVEAIMSLLVMEGSIDEANVLWGFPHPSGANGHRHQQFADKQSSMRQQVLRWQSERNLRIK